MTLNPSTRRVNQRHDVDLPVRIEVGSEIRNTTIKNMSVGGLYIEDAHPYTAQQIVKVYFTIPTLPEEIDVECVIRWLQKDASGDIEAIGVQFIGMKAKQVWALTKFFASLTASQAI
ncbi:PilZ domain-containing protein [Myxococcota bacterium]|nr:PilZ domain-containing protein [Myxococcota bacterium]MBU1379933.1 PilZ domain-containing protein [Myxococcota bacterium]MBU1498571.1 PilZ domain-containing protein [Myxococcota bacterium]